MNRKSNRIISLVLAGCLVFSMLFSLTSCFDTGGQEGESGGENLPPMQDPIDDNYRTFYQIFVGSFSDSNGDGIGDLQGVINRMDYLNDGDINSGNDLGIQGIWLSPIFESPTYHKYDAIDYYDVDDDFGSEATLKELIDLCHSRNVKIILDLVVNHTSSDNDWFIQYKVARKTGDTENKYYDYYSTVTTAEKQNGISYKKIDGTDFWYECNFSDQMPELNYDNPEVKQEMLDVAKYYLDLGVDGFRFDAVKYIYFDDTERSVEFWNWYMDELSAYSPDIYCVGECWSAEAEVLKYCDAMNCFNFTTSQAEGLFSRTAKGTNISSYLTYIESYQDKVQEANSKGMPMSFLSNHDMDRIAGTFILEDQMRMAANLYLLSPGSPFIYYGEEIGIRGSRGTAMTDANRRLAMLWGDSDTIKNPIGSTYSMKNQISSTVKSQLEDENSLLRAYQEIIAVRNKYMPIARGDYNAVTSSNKNFGGFYVEYKGEILGIFHNTSAEEISIDLYACNGIDGHSFTKVCEALGGDASIKGNVLTIAARTSVILQ